MHDTHGRILSYETYDLNGDHELDVQQSFNTNGKLLARKETNVLTGNINEFAWTYNSNGFEIGYKWFNNSDLMEERFNYTHDMYGNITQYEVLFITGRTKLIETSYACF